MNNNNNALAFVNEAIEAISLECWRGQSPDRMERVEGPEYTIAAELERVDAAIGPRGNSIFHGMSEQVKQCVIALYAARAHLTKEPTP